MLEALKGAWSAPGGRASVRFRYKTARSASPAERTVEPYRVVVRHGRYYLIGYDTDRKNWRFFALDTFLNVPTRAGTAFTTRTIPPNYDSDDVLGFIKTAATPVAVTIEFGPALAAAMTCRIWQRDQHIEHRPDGSAALTVMATDLDEIVRWAFGFAPDAKVIAPLQAVRRARHLAELVARECDLRDP